MIGGENKHARYSSSGSSSGGLTRWFKRIFTKDSSSMSNNRTRNFTEGIESYTPLRADHDHDHDHDHDEGQDGEEDEGEEYEMIKRKSSHDSES